MTRTFIALEMNKATQSYLEEVIRGVALVLPDIRWVDPVGIHLTLAFLGELDDVRLTEAIQAALITAEHTRPFSYTLNRLGTFGSPRHSRVIWMGIEEPTGALSRLHHTLNQELLQRGFELDRRPFSPHLTFARVKSPLSPDEQQQLQKFLAGDQRLLVSSQNHLVTSIQVIESELSRAGAHYSNLRTCSFIER